MFKLMSLLMEELATARFKDANVLDMINKVTGNGFEKSQVADKYLKVINGGSTRNVYALNEHANIVLKVAISPEGVEGNKNEWDLFHCSSIASNYLAKVYTHAPDFGWITMERLERVPYDVLMDNITKLTGYKLGSIGVFQSIASGESRESYHKLKGSSPWFKGLAGLLERCKIAGHDLHENNWGLRRGTNQIIILDYGFKQSAGAPVITKPMPN